MFDKLDSGVIVLVVMASVVASLQSTKFKALLSIGILIYVIISIRHYDQSHTKN